MSHIKRYIDASFCLLLLPAMIAIFPVERWLHHFPLYTCAVGVWLYALYALNRALTVPSLFGHTSRRRLLGVALLAASFAVTLLFARVTLYDPKPHPFDVGVPRRLPIFEQYQQCVWSLFGIVEFFSLAFGIILQFAAQRNKWLLELVEEIQARNLLNEENLRIRQQLHEATEAAEAATAAAAVAVASPAPPPVSAPLETLTLKSGYKNVQVPVGDILFIEAMENYVKIRRRDHPTVVSQISLKAIEELLAGAGFMRVHRSYLVALRHVERYGSKELTLVGHPTPIPIGRTYAPEVKLALA